MSVELLISQDCFGVSLKDGVGVVRVEVFLDPVDRVAEYRWPAVDAVHVRAEEVGFLVSERFLDELRLPIEEPGQALMRQRLRRELYIGPEVTDLGEAVLLDRLEALCVRDDRAVAGVPYVSDRAEDRLVALLWVELDQRVVAVGKGQDLTRLQALGHTVEPEHLVARVEMHVEGRGIGLLDRRELRTDACRIGWVLDIVVRGRDDRAGTLLDVLPDQCEGLLECTASVVDMVDDMGVDVEHRCSSLLFVYCYSPRGG